LSARWRGLLARGRGRRAAAPSGVAALRAALLCVLDRDWSGAEAHLQRMAREDSTQIEVYLALARVFRLRGEVGRAIRVHQNLLLRPDLGEPERCLALRGLAEDFRCGGFLGQASDAYEELLALQPRDPDALRALVRLHREARRPGRALELARRLHRVGRGAGSEEARREEAALELEVAERAHADGRADEARRALRRALRRDPASAAAHVLRGELEVERGRSKRALAAWRRALELDRRRAPELLGKLRSAFAALGRPGEFEPFLRERLRESPGDGDTRLELARLLESRGESGSAVAELRELLAAAPDHLEARAELGRTLRAAGRGEEACDEYAGLVERLSRVGALRPAERGVE
jgi:lipopolysaccharide biosynthesis regulator YciM